MSKTDETYELIRSMSPNEKRAFRLSVIQAGKEANYMRVFSAMDAMDEFDQEKLLRKLRGKKLNLSYEKNYLYKQLLRSLRHFCPDGSSVIEVLDILKSLEMLYRKRLNAQCQKLIRKASSCARGTSCGIITWSSSTGNTGCIREEGTIKRWRNITLRVFARSRS